jgi:hypothetical protein
MSDNILMAAFGLVSGLVLFMSSGSYGAQTSLPSDVRAAYIDNGPRNDRGDLVILYRSGYKARLTSDLQVRYNPVFSPDGSKIAFGVQLKKVNGHLPGDARIVVVDLKGMVLDEFLVDKDYPLHGSGAVDSVRWAGNNKIITQFGFNPDESVVTITDLRTHQSQSYVDSGGSIAPAFDGEHWAFVNGVQHFRSSAQSETVVLDGCDVGESIDKRPYIAVSPLGWSLNTSGTRQLSLVVRQGSKTAIAYTLATLKIPPDFKCDMRRNTGPTAADDGEFKFIQTGQISVEKSRLPVPANRAPDVSWNVFYSPTTSAGSIGDLVVLEGTDDAHLVAARGALLGINGRTTSLTAVSPANLVDPEDEADRLQNAFASVLASNGLATADADVWSSSIALAPRANPYSRQSIGVPYDDFPE